VLDAQAAEDRVQMVRDIARRVHVRQRGPASLIDEHAVVDGRPRRGEQLAIGHDPHPGHHQIALEAPSVLGADTLDPLSAFERRHGITQRQVHAVLAMDVREHLADFLAEDASQRDRMPPDGSHLEPKLAQRGCHLAPDEAKPDYDDASARAGGGADPVTVLDRAKLKEAFHPVPGPASDRLRPPVATRRRSYGICAPPSSSTTFRLESTALARTPNLRVMLCSA
jgi:hypothetical protein